jgi:hypothetical protein
MKKAKLLGLSLLALTLAACTPQAKAPSEDEVANQAAFERIMGRVECKDEMSLSAGGDGCRINPMGGEAATDKHILVDAGPNGDSVIAIVVDSAGTPLQTMEETGVAFLSAPAQQDIDGDGALDLVFARETGNVNTIQALWRLNPATGAYTRLGEISGVTMERTASGELAVSARSSAASWEVVFFKIAEDKLQRMATVEVSAEGMKDDVVVGVRCELIQAAGAETEAAKRATEKTYCAEPVAANVFK